MHLLIILLAVLAFFLYLTLGAAKKPEKTKFYYLYLLVDAWLTSILVYLLVTAFLD